MRRLSMATRLGLKRINEKVVNTTVLLKTIKDQV